MSHTIDARTAPVPAAPLAIEPDPITVVAEYVVPELVRASPADVIRVDAPVPSPTRTAAVPDRASLSSESAVPEIVPTKIRGLATDHAVMPKSAIVQVYRRLLLSTAPDDAAPAGIVILPPLIVSE